MNKLPAIRVTWQPSEPELTLEELEDLMSDERKLYEYVIESMGGFGSILDTEYNRKVIAHKKTELRTQYKYLRHGYRIE